MRNRARVRGIPECTRDENDVSLFLFFFPRSFGPPGFSDFSVVKENRDLMRKEKKEKEEGVERRDERVKDGGGDDGSSSPVSPFCPFWVQLKVSRYNGCDVSMGFSGWNIDESRAKVSYSLEDTKRENRVHERILPGLNRVVQVKSSDVEITTISISDYLFSDEKSIK